MPSTDAAARCQSRVPILCAVIVFLAHTALFGAWIVDDAGITFAYARNLAQGHGLVSQAGAQPVEGYSNPLWTLTVSALYLLRLFVVPWTPKLLACAGVLTAVVLMWRDLQGRAASCFTIALSLVLLVSCSAFVIWTTSGLENALLAALAAVGCVIALRATAAEPPSAREAVWAGVVAALMALTRPDALLYVAAYPTTLVIGAWGRGRLDVGGLLSRVFRMAAGFVPVFGGYLTFRFAYFDDWVPNTFYAKVRPSGSSLLNPGKLLDLVESASGDLFLPLLLLLAAGVLLLAGRRRLAPRTLVLLTHLGIATASYMVMPLDWMGEFRFATPFFLFFYWFLGDLLAALSSALAPTSGQRRAAAAVGVAFAAQACLIFAARSVTFARDPTVPLSVASHYGGHGFNELARHVAVARPSLLTPDLGGVLLESRLEVIDLAGLCDRTIARTLYTDPRRMREYVFGDVRPTFIHTQGAFTRASRLHDDPRFTTDYLPLFEATSSATDWQGLWRGAATVPAWWGDYVRRDALAGDATALANLREAYRREQLASYTPWKRPADRLRSGWPQVVWALRALGSAANPAAPVSIPAAAGD